MNLVHHYWCFNDAVPKKICNKILKLGKSKKKKRAIVGHSHQNFAGRLKNYKDLNEKDKKYLEYKRDSAVVWLDESWIYETIHPFVHTANRNAGWNFQWDQSEFAQFTQYKKGQFYGWHNDTRATPSKDPGVFFGKIRKLSSFLLLSDPHEYEGGKLQFDFRANDLNYKQDIVTAVEVKNKGDLIVFPSHLWHQVTPITKGVRYSMPVWHWGKPFI